MSSEFTKQVALVSFVMVQQLMAEELSILGPHFATFTFRDFPKPIALSNQSLQHFFGFYCLQVIKTL